MNENLILLTDSYKFGHHQQYPEGTQTVFSYFESREGAKYPYTVFFGLQYILQRYLEGKVVTDDKILEAREMAEWHFGSPDIFNEEGWRYIERAHGGYLPLRIRAVPEGTKVPTGHVMMTVENTDPECYWLTNFVETLLVQSWYPSTVATLSHSVKEVMRHFLRTTGCSDIEGTLNFMLHDFGCRGATTMESAALGGAAHLVNFMGTDTVPAMSLLRRYYDAETPAFSVPASEHSTMTAWGKDNEVEAYRNMLRQYPTGIVSVVSDSYDIFNAAENIWGGVLKDEVLKRDGRLVIRPDSGDPVQVNLRLMEILTEKFGSKRNITGHKVLPPQVRLLQGDGMSPESIRRLLKAAEMKGYAAENWVFGMGGGLLQSKVNRDTQRFAFKCSAIQRNGKWQDVRKDPASDPTKASKGGRLTLYRTSDGGYETVDAWKPQHDHIQEEVMRTVFLDGMATGVLGEAGNDLEAVRQRAAAESSLVAV